MDVLRAIWSGQPQVELGVVTRLQSILTRGIAPLPALRTQIVRLLTNSSFLTLDIQQLCQQGCVTLVRYGSSAEGDSDLSQAAGGIESSASSSATHSGLMSMYLRPVIQSS